MDVASSLAGLIALAALAAQTTVQTINTLKTLKELPDDLQSVLQWLDRLSLLLEAIKYAPSQAPIEPPQSRLLSAHVQATLDAVNRLLTKIKSEIAFLDSSGGVKRQARKVKIFLDTTGTEKQTQKVRQAVEALHLCHSEISR